LKQPDPRITNQSIVASEKQSQMQVVLEKG
jgi:hypothetical protein